MDTYSIKVQDVDFKVFDRNPNAKGSRVKKMVIDKDGNKAFFKYEEYNASESCSEKLCCEIAKVLGYKCANIELAYDNNGKLGILNYLFLESDEYEHMDAITYLVSNSSIREKFYTISNIKYTLDNLDVNLFSEFIALMIFDALVGETDRHEENWGVLRYSDGYKFSPLYDNGANLLRYFKDDDFANKYYSGQRNFNSYIMNSRTCIYKEGSKKYYKHFELIEYLYSKYPLIVRKYISELKKFNDKEIYLIVGKIPDELLTNAHKDYIIQYLIKRRDILLSILQMGCNDEK